MNKKISFLSLLLLSLLSISLFFVYPYSTESSYRNSEPDDIQHAAISSEEKLPWPHQRPGISQDEYENLIENLWIINNYGLYQASEDKSLAYFHDGLDIVVENGTKLYSVESGYVKSGVTSGYIIIGDTEGDRPGNGWLYAHVNNIQFQEGDYIYQGDYIADVYFLGLSHVHLNRVFLENGSWNDIENINCVCPDKYFYYVDTQPPVIRTPFSYFQNNTDIFFEDINPTVVRGDVDIVVGMRDQGEFAHSKDFGFGDRLCVTRIEYEISGNNIQPVYKKSFDFTKIIINNLELYGRERVFTVFKHYKIFHPFGITGDKVFSYYIITNTDGTGEFGKIDLSAQDYAWNTAAVDASGNPRFPDGQYTITVKAWDFLGNCSMASDIVEVRNVKKGRIRR
ncbi:MAG: peptidoglycan DD-metalloendopeptidase family protein [Candidatus Aminicenantaceae bacterium]